ncbi:uncharacterized protein [Ptychodera flava]|uniref:uncharacterized protein n=1 Tax=Ptychodera flava TaxID=63121 RepID=UPI00396A04C9
MKFIFEVCNLEHPNAKENTVVWLLFEAGDSHYNTTVALENYAQVGHSLNGHKWNKYTIEVVMCGDYEYETKMYGLSGAAGKHFCLWCNIDKDLAKEPLSERGKQCPRTVEDIIQFNNSFVAAGARLKDASKYFNCVHQPMLMIPISQVCPPALHLSLGIFLKLFNLLESYCIPLDVQMYLQIHKNTPDSNSQPATQVRADFNTYLALAVEIASLKDTMAKIDEELLDIDGQMISSMLDDQQESDSPQTSTDMNWLQAAKCEKQRELQTLQTKITTKQKSLPSETGYIIQAIDMTLQSINVKRQAYHGKSFIGNHVDTCLKPKNINKICATVVNCVQSMCPSLIDMAHEIHDLFEPLLLKFSRCHSLYSVSRPLSPSEISEFGK